jgi:hypothetical protein
MQQHGEALQHLNEVVQVIVKELLEDGEPTFWQPSGDSILP